MASLLSELRWRVSRRRYLVRDALWGLAFEVRQMRDTPAGKLDLPKALRHIENDLIRIAREDVDERDLIG